MRECGTCGVPHPSVPRTKPARESQQALDARRLRALARSSETWERTILGNYRLWAESGSVYKEFDSLTNLADVLIAEGG